MQTGERSCGACTLCCKRFAVAALHKPVETWCEHCAIGEGCRVYDSRPEECRTFTCIWLASDQILPDEMYPPVSKVIVTAGSKNRLKVGGHTVAAIQFDEMQPGAADRRVVQQVIERFRRSGFACVIIPPGNADRRLLLPTRPPRDGRYM